MKDKYIFKIFKRKVNLLTMYIYQTYVNADVTFTKLKIMQYLTKIENGYISYGSNVCLSFCFHTLYLRVLTIPSTEK